MKKLPITFLENAYKVEDIEKILKTRYKLKKPIKLVIADMAGRMSTDSVKKTDREQLNEVSKALFRMSKKYHCTIIGTVQISREGLMTEEPQLSHLKETGNWEEDADKVFMMWADKEDKDKRIIALRKNRTGKKDFKYKVILDGCHMRFKEDI
jgi:replicative DNA helicase